MRSGAVMPKGIPDDTPQFLPNCGVVSVAMIAGVTHQEAWDALAGRERNRKRFKGRTYDSDRQAVLRDFGVEFEQHNGGYGLTLGQWLKSEFYTRSNTYELCVTRHAMCLHRGKLYDQNGDGRVGIPAYQSKHLRRKVQGVLLITGGSPLRPTLDLSNGATS